jgi:acyl-CoA thioesterase
MYREPPFIAPSLDLYASFHHSGATDEWLLLDGHSPVAGEGLLAWNGRVWTRGGQLLASGGGQAVFRHT